MGTRKIFIALGFLLFIPILGHAGVYNLDKVAKRNDPPAAAALEIPRTKTPEIPPGRSPAVEPAIQPPPPAPELPTPSAGERLNAAIDWKQVYAGPCMDKARASLRERAETVEFLHVKDKKTPRETESLEVMQSELKKIALECTFLAVQKKASELGLTLSKDKSNPHKWVVVDPSRILENASESASSGKPHTNDRSVIVSDSDLATFFSPSGAPKRGSGNSHPLIDLNSSQINQTFKGFSFKLQVIPEGIEKRSVKILGKIPTTCAKFFSFATVEKTDTPTTLDGKPVLASFRVSDTEELGRECMKKYSGLKCARDFDPLEPTKRISCVEISKLPGLQTEVAATAGGCVSVAIEDPNQDSNGSSEHLDFEPLLDSTGSKYCFDSERDRAIRAFDAQASQKKSDIEYHESIIANKACSKETVLSSAHVLFSLNQLTKKDFEKIKARLLKDDIAKIQKKIRATKDVGELDILKDELFSIARQNQVLAVAASGAMRDLIARYPAPAKGKEIGPEHYQMSKAVIEEALELDLPKSTVSAFDSLRADFEQREVMQLAQTDPLEFQNYYMEKRFELNDEYQDLCGGISNMGMWGNPYYGGNYQDLDFKGCGQAQAKIAKLEQTRLFAQQMAQQQQLEFQRMMMSLRTGGTQLPQQQPLQLQQPGAPAMNMGYPMQNNGTLMLPQQMQPQLAPMNMGMLPTMSQPTMMGSMPPGF